MAQGTRPREHGIDCLDNETASKRYTILKKVELGAAALHAPSYDH